MTEEGWNLDAAVEEKFLAGERTSDVGAEKATRDAEMGEDETMRRSEATVDARAELARLRLINIIRRTERWMEKRREGLYSGQEGCAATRRGWSDVISQGRQATAGDSLDRADE